MSSLCWRDRYQRCIPDYSQSHKSIEYEYIKMSEHHTFKVFSWDDERRWPCTTAHQNQALSCPSHPLPHVTLHCFFSLLFWQINYSVCPSWTGKRWVGVSLTSRLSEQQKQANNMSFFFFFFWLTACRIQLLWISWCEMFTINQKTKAFFVFGVFFTVLAVQ